MELEPYVQTLRLAARVHGLLSARLDGLNQTLRQVVSEHTSLFRRPKAKELAQLSAELPILILILALQEAEESENYPGAGLAEFFKSCLVHFFSVHYVALYLEHQDPIRETHARLDWYLDGREDPPAEKFAQYAGQVFAGLREESPRPLVEFVEQHVLPEVKKALDLAPKYRH